MDLPTYNAAEYQVIQKPRKTQRPPKSCYQCSKRRVKCSQQIPCRNCINRGQSDKCFRETVIVNGVILNDTNVNSTDKLKIENEYLRERVKELEAKLNENHLSLLLIGISSPDGSVVSRDYIDKLSSGVRLVARDLLPVADSTETERLTNEKLASLSRFITQEVSTKLIEFNLGNLYFIHTAVHPRSFLAEHEEFWNDSSKPKHLSIENNQSDKDYLWMAIWYALLSGSLYTLDTKLETDLSLSSEQYFEMAKISALASLECLHRGQFLRFPNIRSVQAFCVLASCFHGFSGIHLQNSLLSCMIYIAQCLNLHKLDLDQAESLIDFEVSCRLWWILVVIDFLEDIQRYSMVSDNFQTPIPRNIRDSDLDSQNLNIKETEAFTSITYNRMIMRLSRIKKSLYHEDNPEYCKFTLNQLNLADIELLRLQDTISDRSLNQEASSEPTRFAVFLMEIKLAHERLIVNRMVISLISKETWAKEYRYKCLSFAITILEKFNDKLLPFYFRKYWVAGEHSIGAVVFLILDLKIHKLTKSERNYRLKLINDSIDILVLLKKTHTVVSQGLKIVEALLSVLQHNRHSSIMNVADNTEISKTINSLKCMPRIYGCADSTIALKTEVTQQEPLGNDKKYAENILHDLLYDNDWEQLLAWINSSSS